MLAGCGGDSKKIDIELELDTTLLKQAHLNQYQIILELELKNNQVFVIEHGFELSNNGSSIKNIHNLPLDTYLADIAITEHTVALDSDMANLYHSSNDETTYQTQVFLNRVAANSTVNVSANSPSNIQYSITISDSSLNDFQDVNDLGIKVISAGGIEYHYSSFMRTSEAELNGRSGAFGIGSVPGHPTEVIKQDGYQIRSNAANSTYHLSPDFYNSKTMQHKNELTSVRLKIK